MEGTGTFGGAIPADLTKFAPAGYAVPGARSGAENISADGGDVVNVVYSKKTNLSYTVNYYKDSIEEGNYLDKDVYKRQVQTCHSMETAVCR